MEHLTHLNKDKLLKTIIAAQQPYELVKKKGVYLHLCASIMSQQLNTKVATIIYNRFLDLYKNKKPTARQIVDTPIEILKSIGLSNAKANYVQNVCRFFIEEKITDARLHKMSNEEVIAYLTQIKGVGRWTTEMLLMFALGREDLFALDDLGLQNAVIGLYDLKHRKKKALHAAILKIADQWTPYRTYACMYLWRWKDNPPIEKKTK